MRAPLPIEMILGNGKTPAEHYEICRQLGWFTPAALAVPDAVTDILRWITPDRTGQAQNPIDGTWTDMIGGGGESTVEQAFGRLHYAGYLDADLCLCFLGRIGHAPVDRIVGAVRAHGGQRLDDATIVLPLAEILCSGPDRCRSAPGSLDNPPAPSASPACQLALDSPPHQMIAFAFRTVLMIRPLPHAGHSLSSADYDTPLRDLARRLEQTYLELWAPPWRATNPVRVQVLKAGYAARQPAQAAWIAEAFAPLHDLMDRPFGSGRIDTALLDHYPAFRDRLIGDTTLWDYGEKQRDGSPPAVSVRSWARAVDRRLTARFGRSYREASAATSAERADLVSTPPA
ncbi:MAG: hypothetical protein U0893_04235 [Chloroflexota bacterium]